MANDDVDGTRGKIFGNLDPDPATHDHLPGDSGSDEEDVEDSERGKPITGGTGTETGGTRNYRQGTGATGGDIGNRPE